MEDQLLQMVDQDPAGALYHALRQTGRSRGKHDVKRVLKRKLLKMNFQTLFRRQEILIRDRIAEAADIRFFFGIGNDDDLLDRWKILDDLRHTGDRIEALPFEEVAVGDEKNFRLDLPETVQYPLDPEIGRAGRPNRPDACRGEHRRHGLGHVRHEPDDTVAGPDPAGLQTLRQFRHLIIQFGIGHLHRRVILALEDEGHGIILEAQQVFRKVQTGAGKPLCSGHFVFVVDHPIIAPGGMNSDEIPDRCPEFGNLVHRPAIQAVIVGESLLVPIVYERHEAVHVAVPDAFLRRLPQHLPHLKTLPVYGDDLFFSSAFFSFSARAPIPPAAA